MITLRLIVLSVWIPMSAHSLMYSFIDVSLATLAMSGLKGYMPACT